MKYKFNILLYVIIFILLMVYGFSMTACRYTVKPEKSLTETKAGQVFTSFIRHDPSSGNQLYFFEIPESWEPIYEDEIYTQKEAFFNQGKSAYAIMGFENIEVIEFLDIKDLRTKKDYIKAARKIISNWEQNKFLDSALVTAEGKALAGNERVSAYFSEIEARIDFEKAGNEFNNFKDSKKQLVYILFFNYENRFAGYFILFDCNFDKESDVDIMARFAQTLKIFELKK